MSVVDKEVQCVNHFSIVTYKRHFNRLLNHFSNGLLSFLFFLEKLNLHLLLTFFEKEFGFADDLFTLFQGFVNLGCLLKDAYIVSIKEFSLFLLEELGAEVSLLVKFLCFELHINKVSILEKFREFVQLGFLQYMELLVERVEEVYDALAERILQVELFTLSNLLSTLE